MGRRRHCRCCVCWRPRGVYHVSPSRIRPPRRPPAFLPCAGGGWTNRLAGLVRSSLQPPSPTALAEPSPPPVPKSPTHGSPAYTPTRGLGTHAPAADAAAADERAKAGPASREREEEEEAGDAITRADAATTLPDEAARGTPSDAKQFRIYQTITRKVQKLLFRKQGVQEEKEVKDEEVAEEGEKDEREGEEEKEVEKEEEVKAEKSPLLQERDEEEAKEQVPKDRREEEREEGKAEGEERSAREELEKKKSVSEEREEAGYGEGVQDGARESPVSEKHGGSEDAWREVTDKEKEEEEKEQVEKEGADESKASAKEAEERIYDLVEGEEERREAEEVSEEPQVASSRTIAKEIVSDAIEQGALAVSEGIYVSDRLVVSTCDLASDGEVLGVVREGEEHIYEVPADLVREAQLHLLVLRGGRRALTPSPGQEEGRRRRKEDVVIVRRRRRKGAEGEQEEEEEEELVSVVRRSRTESCSSSVSEGSVRRVSRVVSEGGEEAGGGGGGGGRVKSVRRVVSLTQAQWRRLQGSVGSLTTALRSRYHNLRRLQHPHHAVPHHHHHPEGPEEEQPKQGEVKEEQGERERTLGDGWAVQEDPARPRTPKDTTDRRLAPEEGRGRRERREGGRREKEEEGEVEKEKAAKDREGRREKGEEKAEKRELGRRGRSKEEEIPKTRRIDKKEGDDKVGKVIREEDEKEVEEIKKEEEREGLKEKKEEALLIEESRKKTKEYIQEKKRDLATVIESIEEDKEKEQVKEGQEEGKRAKEVEDEREREKQLERAREIEREKDREREKEREKERAVEREIERERVIAREREIERKREIEREKEKEREKEIEREKEERRKEIEREKEEARQKEIEREKEKEREQEIEREKEKEKAEELEREKKKGGASWKRRSWREASYYNKKKRESELADREVSEILERQLKEEEEEKEEKEQKRKKEEKEERKKEEEKRKKEEEEERRIEEEKRKKEEEEERKKEEQKRKKEEEEERKKQEEKRKKEEEEERRIEEEKRRKEEEEKRKREEEEERKRKEEEERKRIEEERKRKEEEEIKRKEEAEQKRKEEEKKRKEEEEIKRKEEAERKRKEEERKRKEEAERKRKEEEERKRKEEEERKRVEEERKRKEEEEIKRKEEAERKRKEEEEIKRKEEAERKRKEEEERKRKEEEERKRVQEERKRKEEEEIKRKEEAERKRKEEEERKRKEAEERKKKEEERRRQEEEEIKRKKEEERKRKEEEEIKRKKEEERKRKEEKRKQEEEEERRRLLEEETQEREEEEERKRISDREAKKKKEEEEKEEARLEKEAEEEKKKEEKRISAEEERGEEGIGGTEAIRGKGAEGEAEGEAEGGDEAKEITRESYQKLLRVNEADDATSESHDDTQSARRADARAKRGRSPARDSRLDEIGEDLVSEVIQAATKAVCEAAESVAEIASEIRREDEASEPGQAPEERGPDGTGVPESEADESAMSRRVSEGSVEGEPVPKRPSLGEGVAGGLAITTGGVAAFTTTPATPSPTPSPPPSPLPSPALTPSPSQSISMTRKMFCQGMIGSGGRRLGSDEGDGEDDAVAAAAEGEVSEGDAQKMGFVFLAVAQQQQQQPFERTESMIAMRGSRDEDAEEEVEDLPKDEELASEGEGGDAAGDSAKAGDRSGEGGVTRGTSEAKTIKEIPSHAEEATDDGRDASEGRDELGGDAGVIRKAKEGFRTVHDEAIDAEETGVEAEEGEMEGETQEKEEEEEEDEDSDEYSDASGFVGQYNIQHEGGDEEDAGDGRGDGEGRGERETDVYGDGVAAGYGEEEKERGDEEEDEKMDLESDTSFEETYEVALKQELNKREGETRKGSGKGKEDIEITMEEDLVICTRFVTEEEIENERKAMKMEETPKGKEDERDVKRKEKKDAEGGRQERELKRVEETPKESEEQRSGQREGKAREGAERGEYEKEAARKGEEKIEKKMDAGREKRDQRGEKGDGSRGSEQGAVQVGVETSVGGPRILITAAHGGVAGGGGGVDSDDRAAEMGGSVGSTVSAHHHAHHHHHDTYASASTLAAHLAAHPRPPTPKSPITVDEWVAALPHPTSVDDEGDAWTCSDPGGEEVAEDLLNLGAEAGLLGGPGVLVTTAGEEGEVPRRGNVVSSVAPSSVTQPATVMTGAKDVPSSPRLRGPSLSPLQTSKLSASPSSTRPLTLSDVASTMQRQQEQEQAEALGVEGRRSQFAGLREKQASFQSELSGLSLQSKSSIDSLLESREADPVDVLLSLGFGGQAQDTVTRIPERFLRPSQVPGNNIEEFLKSEDEFSDMMESAEWMPGLDPQALRRSSVATVSPLMLRLLDTIRESRSRHHQSSVSEDTSSAGHTPAAATPPSGVSKFAAVAKSLALKNSVMQTLSSSAGRPNKLSVLNAENRRLLDLQGQKSPEVPRKRLIIGQSSFDLGRDGELIANEDEGMGISVDQEEDDEDEDEDEKDEGDGIGDKEEGDDNSEDGRERMTEGDEQEEGSWRRHGLLQHKDSVWSMASSATSIDSSEEEIREQRHRLQLSLSRRPLQPDPATLTPTTPAESLDSPQPVFSTSGADSSDRYRKIMRRLSGNKRHSTVSSGGSWEMDERIPEEDLEDDVNHEPLHDQVICEADASGSLNSCSDTRASVISGSPHQRHSSSLSPEGQGNSRVQGSSPSPPVSVSNKKRQGDSSSSQNGPDSSMPLLSFSQHSHNPALIHPVPILLQHSTGPAPLPRTSRIGEESSPCLAQRGSGGVLRRQQRVDDGYADTGGRQMLQPPNLHSQHCRHQHSSGHQVRGSGNDEDRSGPTGLLCRSGSAQSDSSGFMDGDVVETETRTPTQQNLSSVQLSTSPQAHTGHNWWWSRESGGSLETVRHAPLSRTMALRPGHSHSHYQRTPRSHLLNHQTSLPSWPRGMHDPSLSLGGQHPSHRPGGKARVVRHHLSPDPLLFPCKGSLGSSSNHPSCNLAPCVDTSVPQLLHHCSHSVVHPYVSQDNTSSAFQPPVLDGTSYPGHLQDLKCRFCYPTVISTDAYTPTLAAAGFSSRNTASLNQGHQPSSSLRGRWQKRRHSLPEPLPSGVHNSDMSCSPPPSSPFTSSMSPLPITSELPFLPQSSREVHHTVNGGCARGGKTGENDAGRQCQVHSLPSDMLLVALHTYRHQLVHQEHLSRQLHDTAMDIPSPSVNTQHLSQQLRNISAIRAAIRAEVTHMEQLMASTQHTSLSPACINNVITQMVMLLQQQSELCRDLETLTVASSHTSLGGASHSTQHLSQESSFDNLPEKPNPLCRSPNPPDLIHHDTAPSPKLENSVHEPFGNHMVHDSAAWKSSEQDQGFLNCDSNLGTANHVRNDSSCANHSIEKLVFTDHSTVKTISSKQSQEKAIISGYSEQCTNIPDQKSDSERKTEWFQEPQEVIHGSVGNVELNNNSIDSCLRLEELNPDGSADHSQLASYKSTRSPFNPWNSAQGKPQSLAKTFDRHQEEALEGGTDMATFLGSGDVSSDTSSLASQVAQLVQQQVQIQTQVLEEQLHQQTKDMADIKSMMEILINKMS